MSVLRHLAEKMPGVLGLKPGHGFSLGHTPNLPTCEARREGEERLVRGTAGVATRKVVCVKNAADAYAWWDSPLAISVLTNTATYNPPSINANARASTTLTVTGAAIGDIVVCKHTTVITQDWDEDYRVSATDTVLYVLTNRTGSPIDLGSGTLRCMVFKVS